MWQPKNSRLNAILYLLSNSLKYKYPPPRESKILTTQMILLTAYVDIILFQWILGKSTMWCYLIRAKVQIKINFIFEYIQFCHCIKNKNDDLKAVDIQRSTIGKKKNRKYNLL
jgi:hypothetical protein